MKKIVATDKCPAAVGPYSQGILVGDTLYASGMLGLVPSTGELAEGGLEGQAKQALENVANLLASEGMTFANVVKSTCFLTNMGDFAAFNAIYSESFGDSKPARSCVEVSALPRGGVVEIEIVAVK